MTQAERRKAARVADPEPPIAPDAPMGPGGGVKDCPGGGDRSSLPYPEAKRPRVPEITVAEPDSSTGVKRGLGKSWEP